MADPTIYRRFKEFFYSSLLLNFFIILLDLVYKNFWKGERETSVFNKILRQRIFLPARKSVASEHKVRDRTPRF